MHDPFVLAGRSYTSRLIVGTGKYRDFRETKQAIERAGAEIVTVAVRRVDFDDKDGDITAFLPQDVLLLLASLVRKRGGDDCPEARIAAIPCRTKTANREEDWTAEPPVQPKRAGSPPDSARHPLRSRPRG